MGATLKLSFGLCAVLTAAPDAAALTIIRDFIGGTPATNNIGSGNLVDVFNAAADIWEQAILDEHTLLLHYGWAPNGGAEHWLIAQGGSPNREIEGQILFNNDGVPGHYAWYLDPTPALNEEFASYCEAAQDLGLGIVNVTRMYQDRMGYPDSSDKSDLLTTALHEIGHALGISSANISYLSETTGDTNINMTSPRPYAGMQIPVVPGAAHIHYDLAANVLMASGGTVGRILPSTIDILAEAQISGFSRLNLNFSPALAICRSGPGVDVSWLEAIPGYALEQRTNLGEAGAWLAVAQPVFLTNDAMTVVMDATNVSGFFRLRRTNDFALEVSAISQSPPDVDPGLAGVQAHAGSTVRYSVTMRHPEGVSVHWYWMYSLNGAAPVALPLGSGPVAPLDFTYGPGESGNSYAWTLNVFTEHTTAVARLTVLIVP